MNTIRLKPGRERSVLKRHPWIFSGAVAEVHGDPQSGDPVEIQAHDGDWLARASYSPQSRIRARIWTWEADEPLDEDLVRRRLDRAIETRAVLLQDPDLDAFREAHAESDRLPGLVIDRYGPFRVVQFLATSSERWRDCVVSHLASRGDCKGIYERSDVEARSLEGLELRRGSLWGEEPPSDLVIREYGLKYYVDIPGGHKTGAYLDQRENRQFFRSSFLGGIVLDAFCYSGSFTLAALSGGAQRVMAIDSSERALELTRQNITLNKLGQAPCELVKGDVFHELRRLRDQGASFDVIVLDPPRFAPTASQAQKASRGYKDVNLLAFKLLRPGGMLYTFSCSGGISPELFQKIVAGAALDAGVEASIIAWLQQPLDHPVALNFPEGRYLKGLVCRVV